LLGLLDPFLFGFPGIDRFWGGEVVEFAFGTFYPGGLAVLAAAFAVPACVRAWRRGEAVPAFLWAGALVGVLLALGRHTPVYPWLHEHVAGFGRSRWPSAAGYLIAVHVAALAGVGFGEVLAERARIRRASFAALAIGTLLLSAWALARGPASDAFRALQLAGAPPYQAAPYEAFRDAWLATLPVRGAQIAAAGALGLILTNAPRRFALVWIAILVLDLFVAAGRFEAPAARGFYDHASESVVAIRNELGDRRMFTPRTTDQLGNFLYGTKELTPFEWARNAMLCNANGPFGINQANGCEPLGPRRHEAFTQAFDSDETPWEIKERLFDLWDAALLVTSSVRPLEVPTLRNPDQGIELSRHEPRLGRATLLSGWKTHTDSRTLLAELLSPRHDPGRLTLLEPVPGRAPPPATAQATEPALPVHWEAVPNGFRAAWMSGPAGVLRVLQSWAPGWEATVNGERTAVHRADFLFMAVPVPRGPCEVELTYRPASLRRGVWLSLLGLVGIGGCLLIERRTNSLPSKLE
jgi:hypothetical protein